MIDVTKILKELCLLFKQGMLSKLLNYNASFLQELNQIHIVNLIKNNKAFCTSIRVQVTLNLQSQTKYLEQNGVIQ